MLSAVQTVRGERGLEARAEKKARLSEVFQRAAELHYAKTPTGEMLKTLAVEYPDVALEIPGFLMKMSKKLGLENLAEGL